MIFLPRQRKGFTLVEMMIAVGIFSVVSLVAVGATLFISGASRNTRAMKQVLDGVNFVLEAMSREARMGHTYVCGDILVSVPADPTCVSGNAAKSTFSFKATDGSDIVFLRNTVDKSIQKKVRDTSGSVSTVTLTSPDVQIESLKFIIRGAKNDPAAPDGPPRVVMSVRGAATYRGTSFDFVLQTMAAQRKLDSY